MSGVIIEFSGNLEQELKNLKEFPKDMAKRTKMELEKWYEKEFKPQMGRIIHGFKGKDVPAKNSEPYATYKATGVWTDRKGRQREYNIVRTGSHSLGEVGKAWGRHAHAPGQLYRGAMNVRPMIEVSGTSIRLKAEFNKPFYLPVVHDGGYNLKQAYPFIDAALVAKYDSLVKKIEDGIVLEWNI